jgi:hypothetical protein
MAKKDKYIRFSGVNLSGSLDIIDDKLVIVTEDMQIDIISVLEENIGCHVKIDMFVTEEITE